MEVSPAEDSDGGTVGASQVEEVNENDDDVCRICRFPCQPGNPLRYPCACRGSIKYVHQECLLLWLNRRGTNKCEVCRRQYSFASVYLENAPARLSFREFTIGLGLRVLRFMKPLVQLFLAWLVVIPLVTYWILRLPWGSEAADELQGLFTIVMPVPWIASACLVGLSYCVFIVYPMIIINIVRASTAWLNGMFPGLAGEVAIENGQRQGVARVAQMIRRYIWILCDWWFQRLGPQFELGPGEPHAGVIQNAPPLHEFGVIRRFLFLLDDNAFAVLATNVLVSLFFVLLPFSLGRIVLTLLWHFPPTTHMVTKLPASLLANSEVSSNITKQFSRNPLGKETIGANFLSDETPVLVGYVVIFSLAFSYLGSVIIMRHASVQAITRRLSLGFHFLTVTLPSLSCIFLVTIWIILAAITRHFATVVKVVFVLSIKFAVLPLICGCWLDICTLPIYGVTVAQRLEFLSDSPSLIFLYWFFGSFYMGLTFSYMNLVQKIVRKQVFRFLQDVADPNYKISELHLGYILLALAIHGILIVIVFHLPIRIITLICPSLFPLNLWSFIDRDTLADDFAYVYIHRLGAEWLIKLVHPARIEPLVRKWFISVSSQLQLDDFLLTKSQSNTDNPQNQNPMSVRQLRGSASRVNQNARPALHQRARPYKLLLVFAMAEGSIVSLYTPDNAITPEENTNSQMVSRFLLKITLFLMLAGLSLLLLSSLFMALPILLGRVFFSSTSTLMLAIGLKYNDIYAFWIGCRILQATQISCSFVFDHIRTGRTILLLNRVLMWIRNLFLFSIWISVIPGLLGLLIDLMVIIPLRVPLDETPVLFLLQDWLLGLVLLHIWTALVMLKGNKLFATAAWQEKLRRIKTVGVNQLPATWLLLEFLGSIINTLLTALCVPYLLQKSIFPTLGYSLAVNSAVQRFIWPAFLAAILIWFCFKLTKALIVSLHCLIFEDRYVVGRTLCDFREDLELGLSTDNNNNNNNNNA